MWVAPKASAEWHYSGEREGSVAIAPHEDPNVKSLVVKVEISYKGLGDTKLEYEFPKDLISLQEIFEAKTQGWPMWRYHFCRFFLAKLGWPHLNAITWPQQFSREDALRQFALHRVGDLLGALSLASHDALPSCVVTSRFAGHEADLGALSKVSWVDVQ